MIDAKRKMNKRMRGRVGEARQDEARGNEKAASRSGWQRGLQIWSNGRRQCDSCWHVLDLSRAGKPKIVEKQGNPYAIRCHHIAMTMVVGM